MNHFHYFPKFPFGIQNTYAVGVGAGLLGKALKRQIFRNFLNFILKKTGVTFGRLTMTAKRRAGRMKAAVCKAPE